ncbi:bifunctional phosphopantothenoylcysteine decarboxylase/phosphopantothenate--cysteine ligase CoaBC [Sphingomonas melonis]|uniref:Coenzyme A biosynthesis bifunctional protein CoaBC n=1 Tax=Sphingomonas melonis TaxID=152682 RepID=A0A7Y9FUA4_9SPHN|nr:bifunctional phosphopantothenoylcysteine decarboxylase/phosphopantothenate--cysteine ligase CoaBC [Sphingomonas melonis]NYD92281.1 phosphopantothenoylcysteine decarboxylase/phosphopantothenate--cysteine ligase [Sphingomonas melonis]
MTRILLIVGGGIAAYKACELIRLLRRRGYAVRCVMTEGASHFVTPMTLAALSEDQVYTSLWDLKDEAEMGHIQLSRQADLIVIAPATADLLARMAGGMADDLATTLLLATDTPVLAAPAMNVRMWQHAATVRNVAQLRADGITILAPDEGAMACGEFGPGRLPEPEAIAAAVDHMLTPRERPLAGRHVLVTAGPTHEPIDPVRYIANRSSGRQGFAIAEALAALGAEVTLVAGPVALATPVGVQRLDVVTAAEMAATVQRALPVDAAVMVAAVADWRVAAAPQKVKKGETPPALVLAENEDILATLAHGPRRPRLVVGFAAETERVVEHAVAKRLRKNADWIVANDVSGDVFGGEANTVHLATADGVEHWERLPKEEVARRLAQRIAIELAGS